MDVQRVFGCGIDRQIFKAKHEALQEKDQVRLEKVARRLYLTLKLRYEIASYSSPFEWSEEEISLSDVEFPSIEIYLLCTCLDTLAGRSDYKDFGEWLKAKDIASKLEVSEVVCLYVQYKEEYGVGRSWRKLFNDLPQSVNIWLANNVVIRRSNQPPVARDQDTSVLVKRLYTYFFEVWRNRFTHSSVSQPVLIAEDVIEPIEGDDHWITPAACATFVLHRDKPNQEWDLSYRRGLDLAIILRVIIHAAALILMDIEPAREHIAANLRNLSRLNALYKFVNEVKSNSNEIGVWSSLGYPKMEQFRSYLVQAGVPNLDFEAASIILDRYDPGSRLEAGLRQMTLEYLNEINEINSVISEFNKSHPPLSSDVNERWQVIKEFIEGLVQTPRYATILEWPSRIEMMNIWLVIRDPCFI
jgi:hypothetical protein